jgi:carboxypeptidase C (cathepsin A)
MDVKTELRETAKTMLEDPMITMAYVEHQMDLVSRLVLDLIDIVDTTAELDPAVKQRVEMLRSITAHSSIDFENLTSPFQNYKVPKTVEHKEHTRKVSTRYLQAQLREGIL